MSYINEHGDAFETEAAIKINMARMEFLDKVLPKPGRILDIGCGVGKFSVYLRNRGWEVTGIDARAENIAQARQNSGIRFEVGHVETLTEHFPITLCFGLLYHLENPFAAIRRLAKITELLVLESRVVRFPAKLLRLVNECDGDDQGLNHIAYIPTKRALKSMLTLSGFELMDCPRPRHPEYFWGQRVAMIGTLITN